MIGTVAAVHEAARGPMTTLTFYLFHFHALDNRNETHSSKFTTENPRDEGIDVGPPSWGSIEPDMTDAITVTAAAAAACHNRCYGV